MKHICFAARGYQYCLDIERGLALRDDTVLKLEKRCWELLLYMATQPSQKLLTRDSLLKEVWHDAHVAPGAVDKAIEKLRRILPDSTRDAAIIQTDHSRGYRFLPRVELGNVGSIQAAQGRGSAVADERGLGPRQSLPTLPTASDFHELLKRIEQVIGWIDEQNGGAIEVLGVLDSWPRWKRIPRPNPSWLGFKYLRHPTGDPEGDEKALLEAGFKAPPFFSSSRNETIALFGGLDDDGTLSYYPVKYRTKLALIDEELSHATISAGAVVVDRTGGALYFHERSSRRSVVHEAHGVRHSFCGAARVGADGAHREVDGTLRAACMREAFEELGEPPFLERGKIAIVKWVQSMGHGRRAIRHEGIDVVYLGANVSSTPELKRRSASAGRDDSQQWEGFVEELRLTDESLFAEFFLNSRSWFPTGMAHHLIWLAAGAPGSSEAFQSGAYALLRRILESFERVQQS